MHTLPFPPRRSHFVAFWLGLNLALGVVLFIALGSLLGPPGIWSALAGTLGLVVGGLIWQDGSLFLYRAWKKASELVMRMSKGWVLAVLYYVVLTPVGLTGARLELDRPSGTMWRPYETEPTDPVGARGARNRTGLGRLRAEARARDRLWWLAVGPFLVVIAALHLESEEEDLPSAIYTLY
jgi:hypothetical protein